MNEHDKPQPEDDTPSPSPQPDEDTPSPSPQPEDDTPAPSPQPDEDTPSPSPQPEDDTPAPSPQPEDDTPAPSPQPEDTSSPNPQPEDDIPSTSRQSPIITVNQLRAGRAMARLGLRELAKAAGLSSAAISLLETGRTRTPQKATQIALREVLVAHGVDFAPGGWTRHIADAYVEGHPPPDCPRCALASYLLSIVIGLCQQTRGLLGKTEGMQ